MDKTRKRAGCGKKKEQILSITILDRFTILRIHIAAMHNPAFLEELLRDVPPVDEKHMTLEHFDTLFNRSQWGTTPFHAAAAHGKLPSIKYSCVLHFRLIDLMLSVTPHCSGRQRSACLDVARLLVEAGTDIEHLNGQGKTALTAPKDDGVDEKAPTSSCLSTKTT